ncbi:MAG TPA: EamA family transporter [Terriglobales bacterium]|jgi:drug/metabolite transporter (DMT)-like permease
MYHRGTSRAQTVPVAPVTGRRHPSRAQLVFGFAAIYLIWGSTYLGIRYAVETIPPLLMMAVRHSVAGIIVYVWARYRGAESPTLKQWMYAGIAGTILFLGGHGTLAWAEQKVPSGLAALLCATLPLWTVLLAWIYRSEHKLEAKAWAGILLGFAGVAILIGPDALRAHGSLDLLAAGTVMFGSFAWAVGTAYSHGVKLPSSTVLSAAMQMIGGGSSLYVASIFSGEMSNVHLAAFTVRSVGALAYLIVFGSIIAFTVFTWLVSVCPQSRVSTYAYVNPVVAVFLGWVLAGEAIGIHTIVATIVILAGVALVSTRTKGEAQAKTETEPLPGQECEIAS